MKRAAIVTALLAALLALPASAAAPEPPTATPPPTSPTDIGGTPTNTVTPTPGPCDGHCDFRACGPPCPDGSPMAVCAPIGDVCGCTFIGCAPSTCAQCACTGDRNGDGRVTVDEIIDTVNNALNGCPLSTPTP
jgi:hypothetical protein